MSFLQITFFLNEEKSFGLQEIKMIFLLFLA